MVKYGKIFILYSLFIKNIFCESFISTMSLVFLNEDFIKEKKNQDDFVILVTSDEKEEGLIVDGGKLVMTIYDKKDSKVIIKDSVKEEEIKKIDLKDKEYGFFTLYVSDKSGKIKKYNLLISDLSKKDEGLTLFKHDLCIKKIEIHELKCKDLSSFFEKNILLEEVVIDKEIEVNNLKNTFKDCPKLRKIDFENIKVLKGCNCQFCFYNTSIESIKTNNYFKPSDLSFMFSCCNELKNVELNFSDDYNKEEIDFSEIFYLCEKLKNIKGFSKFKKFKENTIFSKLKLDELDLSNLEDKLPFSECIINNLIISNKYINYHKEKGTNICYVNDIKKITIKDLDTKNGKKNITITDSDAIKNFSQHPYNFSTTIDSQLNRGKQSCIVECCNSGKDDRKKYNISIDN